jgi:putative PIN family toxin of toxin-antitoxin system
VRLVVDTNVVVSALLWGGTPKALFDLAEIVELEFYTSRTLLDELADVLSRKKLARAIAAIPATPASLQSFYQGFAHVVQPRSIRRVVPNDADDDAVIACALAARAKLIVSGDKHLHSLGGQFQGIAIVTPAQAVAQIGR